MTSSEQLERETEQTRNEITQTLEELRERLTPGHLVDDGLAYAGNTLAGEFLRNLGRQAAANPLALCVAGAGLAWMMLSDGRPTSKLGSNAAGSLTRSAKRARERIGTVMAQTRERAADARDAVEEGMEQTREHMAE